MRVLMLNWRDLDHPEAGGAEKYLVTVAEGLAAKGHDVIFRTAAYPGGSDVEVVNGVQYIRKGGRLSIYPRAVAAHLFRKYSVDIVIDVQNGVPYLSPLTFRGPVVNLVHHVHQKQWLVLFGPRLSRLGWWLESRLAPSIYRSTPYVAVSDSTRLELSSLGVGLDRTTVIHNGTDAAPLDDVARSSHPSLVVLGRLVPQKRIEMALRALASLRHEHPDLTLDVVGSGWYLPQLERLTADLGLSDRVTFRGHVSERDKHHLLARAWVHLMPSLKEGWGLVVVEAGVHGTPTVAFTEAGGPTDSIVHNRTGVLVDGGQAEFTAAVGDLLANTDRRVTMSVEVARWVTRFDWETTVNEWEKVLLTSVERHRDSTRLLPAARN